MAGDINFDNDSLGEGRSFLNYFTLLLEHLILPNHNTAQPTSSPQSNVTSTTRPQNALITAAPLELRQNKPQDCTNLIIASVNRATVEISRTTKVLE